MPESAIAVSVPTLDRLKWWAGVITALSIFIGAVGGTLAWLGLTPVVDRELKATLGALKTEVQGTIDQTKDRVISHANDRSKEVKIEVGEVQKQVGSVRTEVGALVRRLDIATIEALEDRLGRLYQQKTEKSTSLSNIDGLLATKMDPAQRANLIARRAETEATIKWIEGEWASVQSRLQRAKQGLP